MKKIAKLFIALLVALCVLVGQSGALLAMESAPVPAKCTKCPCEIEKPSCCVKKADSEKPLEAPSIPATEQRVLQPVAFEVLGHGIESVPMNAPDMAAVRTNLNSVARSVPLFLRHRAILI